MARSIDGFAFNPWNTTEEFRPLGNLNRARKSAYDSGASHRLSMRWHSDPPLRNRALSAFARTTFRVINRWSDWHRLPLRMSLLNLDMFRFVLRRDNLINPAAAEAPPMTRPVPIQPTEDDRLQRDSD